MKTFLIVLSLIALHQVRAFEKFDLVRSLDSVVDELASAQRELTITHEFSERQIYINRNVMSMYIELMNEQILSSFMDSYAEMATLADTIQSELDGLEQNNFCVDRIRNIFSLQVQRFGAFLSGCIRQSYRELRHWTVHTDELHATAHLSLNQVPNLSIVSLTERASFANAVNFHPAINRLLRITLANTRHYMDEFEEFRRSVVEEEEQILEELTRCDRDLVAEFTTAVNREISRARDCPLNV